MRSKNPSPEHLADFCGKVLKKKPSHHPSTTPFIKTKTIMGYDSVTDENVCACMVCVCVCVLKEALITYKF